jgi:glutathionylspermidine synthase
MKKTIGLLPIPKDKYKDYRNKVIFNCFKWDPQVGDVNTISDSVVVIDSNTAKKLALWSEQLARETVLMEEALLKKPSLYKTLGLPKALKKALSLASDFHQEEHVRLMRFDFHPTMDGWAISEVNSDVPGGFAEASAFPELAASYLDGVKPYGNAAQSLVTAFEEKLTAGSRIGFVHATSYSDDRQVMEFLSHSFNHAGFKSAMISPDHLSWYQDKAHCIAQGQEGPIDGIVRFYPTEWLYNLQKSSGWSNYFKSKTPSCNHPAVVLTQSKRLPLVWDKLDVAVPTWKALLPDTADPRTVDWKKDDWILKPAFGRVGEDISIREVITPKEWKSISWSARLYPLDWIAQRRFKSLPLKSPQGDVHLCIGVFTIEGKFAGAYGRISSYPRIDANAKDIAILIKDEEEI